jgi:hypothetical protein
VVGHVIVGSGQGRRAWNTGPATYA